MNKVRLGIIGLGVQGPLHAEWSANLREAELVAVCDVIESKAKELASKYNCDAYTDYHELLERKDINAVIIVTPPYTHAQVAIDALRAGKHAAVEKPLCMDLQEANEMINAAKKSGMLDCYFENLCYAPAYSAAKKIISDGGVGDVFFVRCGENDGKGIEAGGEMLERAGKAPQYQYGICTKAAATRSCTAVTSMTALP